MPDVRELFELVRKQTADARQVFQNRVNKILLDASNDADSIAKAIGDVSPDEAFDAWVRNLLENAKKHR